MGPREYDLGRRKAEVCCEGFNAHFRDELLTGEIFTTSRESQILNERWRRHYDTVESHSALCCCPPTPIALFQ
ncbi:integrase core domain-containing protein [Thalassovita taeanensis]|uniref:integrase core domain-containing protein n=1 Tax=Thalassovita taeanensis TaxID=657014 RepID=UPI000B7EEB6E|nr:integrase core domain-containing protein [Thalassovita taeanensis]